MEANRQLSDETFYRKETRDMTRENFKIVEEAIKQEIEEEHLPGSATALLPKDLRCSRFYLLPKVHKVNNPGRPVVSSCSCPTEYLSAYIDDVLKPLVQSLPSYIKDSTHLLTILKDVPATESARFLFTMDVKSFYTIIPNSEGLNALKHFLNQRAILNPPTNTIVLAELVLTLNHFEFDSEFYTQIRGVSMGTRMGPSYACLFMGFIEQNFMQTYDGPIPEVYGRYIIDCIGVTSMCRQDLECFINSFNDYNASVKFTWNISDNSLECLDVLMTLTPAGISTSVHYKPTDSHSYLHYSSHHPQKCKDGIPFSQFLRLRRLCSEEEDFTAKSLEMVEFFRSRGYPEKTVKMARERCAAIPRTEALLQEKEDDSVKIPLVLPFHQSSIKITGIIHKNAKILADDDEYGHLFDKNIVTAYKNDKNLKTLLVHSLFLSEELQGTFRCNRSNVTRVLSLPKMTF